jgi:hypothetical protein
MSRLFLSPDLHPLNKSGETGEFILASKPEWV